MKPKKSSLPRLFPDTKVAAYYDPFSQIINLCQYDKSDYDKLDLNNPDFNSINKVSLFEHELTHWLDHISTLWGQRNLILIYNALNARANNDIDEFWRIKHLFNNFSGDDFFHYFTEEYNLHKDVIRSPWRYQISSGIRFSENGKPEYNKPILFVRFNCFDDIPIIRVPVSVASILESNAINSEFKLKVFIANQIQDIVDKNLELNKIKSDWLSILYNKDFALYTVIAHLTANLNNQSDVAQAYSISSAIGTTILNLPEEFYSKMKLLTIGQKEWDRRITEFQNIKDKGFAFYNLLKNLIDSKGKNKYSVDDLLSSSNLPNKTELEQIIIAEMRNIKANATEGPFKKTAIEYLDKGIEIFKIRGIDGRNKNFRNNLFDMKVLPRVIFGDTVFDDTQFKVEDVIEKLNKGHNLNVEETYLTCEFYDGKFNEFVKACGI